ncbi:integral membrane protein, partial [Streptomyces coelicoflavus ZG0656]
AAVSLAVGAATVGGVFALLCLVLGVRGVPGTVLRTVRPVRPPSPRSVTQRHPHGRSRFRFPFRADR